MNDAISNYTRLPSSTTVTTPADNKSAAVATQSQPSASETVAQQASSASASATVASNVNLSNVAQKALAQPGFDRTKVDAIKQAIKNGTYAIDPRRIAQSFVSLEDALPE
jgi:negative regulator of flagellin synthesis FlgM